MNKYGKAHKKENKFRNNTWDLVENQSQGQGTFGLRI